MKNNSITYSKIRLDLGNYDIHNLLNNIKCPTLIIYGEKSIFSNEAVQELKNSIPNSSLITIKRAGHFPYMESPAEFLNTVREFYNKSK